MQIDKRYPIKVEHWVQGESLFLKVEDNLQAISKELNIGEPELDFSYKSLGKRHL